MYIKLGEMMSGPTHRASDLIGLGLWPGQGDLKSSSGDSKVQPWLRTTLEL